MTLADRCMTLAERIDRHAFRIITDGRVHSPAARAWAARRLSLLPTPIPTPMPRPARGPYAPLRLGCVPNEAERRAARRVRNFHELEA